MSCIPVAPLHLREPQEDRTGDYMDGDPDEILNPSSRKSVVKEGLDASNIKNPGLRGLSALPEDIPRIAIPNTLFEP